MLRILTLILLCLALPVEARLLRLEVTDTAPAFGGRAFGAVGAYERVTARATLGLDPADPRNAGIADLASALRNAEGLVEATSDVVILRPADATRGNGVLLVDVPNRGRKAILPALNDAPPSDALREPAEAGNGFLLRAGYSIVWAAWQHDVQPAQEVLAKHDETYMPKDVAEALQRAGQWRPEEGPPPPAATWNTMSPQKAGG